jgi:MoxR-like ATPase
MSSEFYPKAKAIIEEVERVIVGKRETVKMLMVALLAGGHALIEDVPGVGKTTLAKALGKATGLTCLRAQFTPDVMASDITGFNVYNKQNEQFEYHPGLCMCNILLADEINRTPPKTQSALLEAMEEHTVTVDGETYQLPMPFMVVATQNELGYVGTFPLPEAQLDRFLMKIAMGYPSPAQEVEILSARRQVDPLSEVRAVCRREDIVDGMQAVRMVHIEQGIYKYIVGLVSATRQNRSVALGASPRAGILLMRAAQACAFLSGRQYVTPEDVLAMSAAVLEHRIQLTSEAKLRGVTRMSVLKDAVKSTPAPFRGNGGSE